MSLNDAGVGDGIPELREQVRHSRNVVAFFARRGWMAAPRHPTCRTVTGERRRAVCRTARAQVRHHRWLLRVAGRRLEARLAAAERARIAREFGGAVWPAAAAWYARGDTQCEVDHEGGFESVSPDGTYAGRFQMDRFFERETPYGARAQARWGRANNWPPYVQINHAWEVWSYAGWSRWPPYRRFGCAAYIGRSYP